MGGGERGGGGEYKCQTEERGSSEIRSCVIVEVDVLGSTSPILLLVSEKVKEHLKKKKNRGRGRRRCKCKIDTPKYHLLCNVLAMFLSCSTCRRSSSNSSATKREPRAVSHVTTSTTCNLSCHNVNHMQSVISQRKPRVVCHVTT